MDPEARRELEILSTIAEGRPVTQRALAERLGIALGLANLYLKRLARKGLIKVTTIPPNRIRYLLTPRGLAEKTRLTYEYLHASLRLYRDARQRLRDALEPLLEPRSTRIALYGTGEAAELTYLTLRELDVPVAAILDGPGSGRFLGHPVLDVTDVSPADYDRVVVATLAPPDRLLAELEARGFRREQLVVLRT